MQFETFDIEGPVLITPRVFSDSRGHFFESYSKQKFAEAGIPEEFVQDNQSLSCVGTVRGLHFQAPPFAQGKLVRVTQGAVLDVIVDIRKASKTFGKSLKIELSADNFRIFWVPPGFAHGFSVLKDQTIFTYKCTNYYNQPSEGGILFNDSDLRIDWEVDQPIVSDKDLILPRLKDLKSPF